MRKYYEFEYQCEETAKKYNVMIRFNVYKDHYGADADGNRGEWRTEIEEDCFIVRDDKNNLISDKVLINEIEMYYSNFEEKKAFDKINKEL